MPIPVACPHCGFKISAPDNLAGKKARCAKCKQVIGVPAIAPPQATQQAPMRPATDRHNPTTGVPGLKRSGPDRSKRKASNGITITQVVVFLVVILGGYFGGKKLGLWDSKPGYAPSSATQAPAERDRDRTQGPKPLSISRLTAGFNIPLSVTQQATDPATGLTMSNLQSQDGKIRVIYLGSESDSCKVRLLLQNAEPDDVKGNCKLMNRFLRNAFGDSDDTESERIFKICNSEGKFKGTVRGYEVSVDGSGTSLAITLSNAASGKSQSSSVAPAKQGDATNEAKFEQYPPALLAELIKREYLVGVDDQSRNIWNVLITEMILEDMYDQPRFYLVEVLAGDGWVDIRRQELSPDCLDAMRVLLRKIGGKLPTREEWSTQKAREAAERAAEPTYEEELRKLAATSKDETEKKLAQEQLEFLQATNQESKAKPKVEPPPAQERDGVEGTNRTKDEDKARVEQPTEPTPPAQPTEPAPKKYAPKPDKALRPGEATYLQKLEQGTTVSVRTRNGKTTECEFVEWDGATKIKLRVGENTFPCRLVDIVLVKSGEYTIYMAP